MDAKFGVYRYAEEHVRQRDFNCALGILSRETYRHRRGLKTLARRKFPGIPLNELVVAIDYTRRNLVFDVRRLAGGPLKPDPSDARFITDPGFSAKFSRPDNAFAMLSVSLKQGGMRYEMIHTGVKELQVPEDDDLRPSMKPQGLRVQGEDTDGNLLETTWDEIDEWLYRIDTFGGEYSAASMSMCSFDYLVTNYANWLN